MKLLNNDRVVEITPEIVAELFAKMDESGQAAFFNHVAEVASIWSGGGWPMQLQAITDSNGLTLAGRRVMSEIGEYSHWGIVCKLEKTPSTVIPHIIEDK